MKPMDTNMRVLQINTTANWGSHGKIAESIGRLVIEQGGHSAIAYGRGNPSSSSHLIRIGSDWDMKLHGVSTRLFDNHGLVSKKATADFLKRADNFNPNIIHLHNIHGYYLNYPLLFEWIKQKNLPVIWTLHDCWPWTGHCAYYTFVNCEKWKSGCRDCPALNTYPKTFLDKSKRNFQRKRDAFLGVDNLTFIPVSNWLGDDLNKSFLKDYPSQVIHNGINIDLFRPLDDDRNLKIRLGLNGKYLLLGVASVWDRRKGLEEFKQLRQLLSTDYDIVLVGLSDNQIKSLPNGIKGIARTENVEELVRLYSTADVFVNPTLEDNFPTTNLEALACGTPVITFNTGGSPEAIDSKTGSVVEYGKVNELAISIKQACENALFDSKDCRDRAVNLFDQNKAFLSYITLYESCAQKSKVSELDQKLPIYC